MLDADEVKKRLEKEGRTRKWFADFCGLEVGSLTHILSGRRQPGTSALKLMAIALGCNVNDITKPIKSSLRPQERKAQAVS